jgi:ribonuclease inhibitor
VPVSRQLKKCRLPGKSIRSPEDFYDQLTRQLHFPDYFGRNLDALWDVLTTDMEGPVEIVWEDAAASRKSMGDIFEKIAALLREVEKERDDFRVLFIFACPSFPSESG